ncbi:MAG: nicotinate-nucleotide adenylyltransferase [Rubripirellula sp.]
MRIGVFGGSFDPIHLGHLWIAEAALELLSLDHVRFIPAAQSPLKPNGPIASQQDRLQMLQLSISGCEGFVVDSQEIDRGDVSYTVDTISRLTNDNPGADLFLIVGSDSLASFGKWHQPERLLEMVSLAVVQRGGEPAIDFSVLDGLASPDRIESFQANVIKMPVIEISSSEIRSRVAADRSIRFRVARPTEALIQSRSIYVSKDDSISPSSKH